MATTIKQGDAYSLPVAVTLDNTAINIADIECVEFYIGELRKTYPAEATFDAGSGYFYVPMTQQETFAFEADSSLNLDVRVKFVGGNVMGVKRMGIVNVVDATSEVIL
jgi:hypothetical protein